MDMEASLKCKFLSATFTWPSVLYSRLPTVHTQVFNGLLFMKLLSRLTSTGGADGES